MTDQSRLGTTVVARTRVQSARVTAWAAVAALMPRWADDMGLAQSWRGDLVAGLTVGVVALPLALAFGITTGLGAAAGLTTAIVAGLVAGFTVPLKGPRPEHERLLRAVGALDRLATEHHVFAELDDAITHARLHATGTTHDHADHSPDRRAA